MARLRPTARGQAVVRGNRVRTVPCHPSYQGLCLFELALILVCYPFQPTPIRQTSAGRRQFFAVVILGPIAHGEPYQEMP
ncbi:hypothetical protein DVDV_0951 [Desulfovibrio sp. DV]|nr:hypothetical protein DVDV_0951 [Desulfovibrio sp. DV]